MTTTKHNDFWTETGTETLIKTWGDIYLKLNRGNLRQKDWKDVANAVNNTRDITKPLRTDVQCKNRLDTLKKKYKLEKGKGGISKWLFFDRMDFLIGDGRKVKTKGGSCSVGNGSGEMDEGGGEEMGEGEGGEMERAIVRFGDVYERVENMKWDEMMKREKERLEFVKEVEFGRMKMYMETQVEIEKIKMMRRKMKKKNKKKKRVNVVDSLSPGKKSEL